jgi:hypothetical protein
LIGQASHLVKFKVQVADFVLESLGGDVVFVLVEFEVFGLERAHLLEVETTNSEIIIVYLSI